MKHIAKLLLAVFVGIILSYSYAEARGSSSHGGRVSVRGYTSKSGKYVAPHQRTAPNKTKRDNWSTKGNVNPNTGKAGTKNLH